MDGWERENRDGAEQVTDGVQARLTHRDETLRKKFLICTLKFHLPSRFISQEMIE